MVIYTFNKEDINPDLLMDSCIANIPGFKSGGYHDGIDSYLADENHGRISWDDEHIWVETISTIKRASIQALIDGME
tara:strand:+ start:670 stop:900 length:231 start_codon:yes stop_codon:yes gene_type:complete